MTFPIYRNIECERIKSGYTRRDLLEALNVSAPTYRKWLVSGGIPSSKLEQMSSLFSCGVDHLLVRYDSSA